MNEFDNYNQSCSMCGNCGNNCGCNNCGCNNCGCNDCGCDNDCGC